MSINSAKQKQAVALHNSKDGLYGTASGNVGN